LYQYNGKELVEDNGLGWNHYGARCYDAALGRFFTTDRFVEKYSFQSAFSYAAANPVKYIDVNGDSLDIFRPDGKLLISIDNGQKANTGYYLQNESKDGSYSNGVAFGYNDEGEDRESALKGEFDFSVVSDSRLNDIVGSALNDKRSKKLSDWDAGLAHGPLDFYGKEDSPIPEKTLFIISGKTSGSNAYNPHDFGNYLTGQSYRILGYGQHEVTLGGQVNNIIYGPSDHGDRSTSGWFDSAGDQRAIRNGYNHYGKNVYLWSPLDYFAD
jgi:RHS repeat-associated protein